MIDKTIYEDKFGAAQSTSESDGSGLTISLRGIELVGECFESLDGLIDKEKFEYIECSGPAEVGSLTNCRFDVQLPIRLVRDGVGETTCLQTDVRIGKRQYSGVCLRLKSNGRLLSSPERCGHFEGALIELQQQFPDGEKLQCCLSCKYSHSHPAGSPIFGGLGCFKKLRESARSIRCKSTLFDF